MAPLFNPRRWQCRCGPLPIHLLFLLLFTAWLVNSRDSENSYVFTTMMRERVLDQEFHVQDTEVHTTFRDISSMSQVQQFLRGPLLHALFGMQDSRVTGPFDVGYVMSQARLVGAARIRQIRVATNSCYTTQMRHLVSTCYPSLYDGTRRTAPIYGTDLGGGLRRVYTYSPPLLTDLPHMALVYGYMPGGYVVDLPARRLHAAAVLDMMERDAFISIETRALIVDFTLYNANINTFCVARITFEALHTVSVPPLSRTAHARAHHPRSPRARPSSAHAHNARVRALRTDARLVSLGGGVGAGWGAHLCRLPHGAAASVPR